MSGIKGKVREQKDFGLKTGLFAGKVILINPSAEEYKDVLGFELKDNSKAADYLGEKEGNTTLRINVWLEEEKTGFRNPVTFFLEDKERTNKVNTKVQYINSIGVCSWADDPTNLPDWFVKRDYRVAKNGEEELYNFARTWLGNLDYKDAEAVLEFNWKNLMKGNVKELRDQIGGEYTTKVVGLATVKTVVKEGEDDKEFQGIYNKAFLPEYSLKQFRLADYNKEELLVRIRAKKSSDLKPHERFVKTVTDPEHGCKDFYTLKDLQSYDANANFVASNKPIEADSPEY